MTIIHRRQQVTGVPPTPPDATPSPELERINAFYAALVRLLGPPDSPDSPLVGTKYDTRLAAKREREEFERRRVRANARWQRWDERLHGHNPVPPPFWFPESSEPDAAEPDATKPDRPLRD